MTITYPRSLPDWCGIRVSRFAIDRQVRGARSGNRTVNATQIDDPYWIAELETVALKYAGRSRFEAWLNSLRGGLKAVRVNHPLTCYPLAHPGGDAATAQTGTLTGVTNGNELALGSLHADLVLSEGDFIGLEKDGLFALCQITEVLGAGTTRTVSVEPAPPADVATSGALVRFERPIFLGRLVPGTGDAARQVSEGHWAFAFTLQESR